MGTPAIFTCALYASRRPSGPPAPADAMQRPTMRRLSPGCVCKNSATLAASPDTTHARDVRYSSPWAGCRLNSRTPIRKQRARAKGGIAASPRTRAHSRCRGVVYGVQAPTRMTAAVIGTCGDAGGIPHALPGAGLQMVRICEGHTESGRDRERERDIGDMCVCHNAITLRPERYNPRPPLSSLCGRQGGDIACSVAALMRRCRPEALPQLVHTPSRLDHTCGLLVFRWASRAHDGANHGLKIRSYLIAAAGTTRMSFSRSAGLETMRLT